MIGSDRQHTLNAALSFEGIGLHTGEHATLTIEPGEPNTGYVFVRVDLDENPEIPAIAGNVSETRRGTTLAANNATVHTTEHVLAALYANGVDNARLLLHGGKCRSLMGHPCHLWRPSFRQAPRNKTPPKVLQGSQKHRPP